MIQRANAYRPRPETRPQATHGGRLIRAGPGTAAAPQRAAASILLFFGFAAGSLFEERVATERLLDGPAPAGPRAQPELEPTGLAQAGLPGGRSARSRPFSAPLDRAHPPGPARGDAARSVLPQAPRADARRDPSGLRTPGAGARTPRGRRHLRLRAYGEATPCACWTCPASGWPSSPTASTPSTAHSPRKRTSARCSPGFACPGALCSTSAATEPRKNLTNLVVAYVELARRRPDAPPLVLVGPDTRWASEHGLDEPSVRATGYLETRGDPGADGRLAGARAALTRRGLRPARRGGHGGRACPSSARGARRSRRSPEAPPASSTRSTPARSRRHGAAARRARASPRSARAGTGSKPRLRLGPDGCADARVLSARVADR